MIFCSQITTIITSTTNYNKKMGKDNDPMAVVDFQLRVRGVKGLRVIDCSVLPEVPSGNTHAPSMVVGERGIFL